MNIKEMRALRGPNYYNNLPVIFMILELEELEYIPTDQIVGFKDLAQELMPSLYEHTCSPGVPGGFFKRLESGTWAGHVAEHVAIELQCLIGHHVSYGKTFTKKPKGTYHVVFRYLDEKVGLRAAEMAVEIVEKLFNRERFSIQPYLDELSEISLSSVFGPSTQAIVDEATKRGIPHIRLNNHSYVQLGQGVYQRRIQATLMDNTSALGVEIAADKNRTKEILSAHGIPVPQGGLTRNFEGAKALARKLGYPVVVKPQEGNHGRGVTTAIDNDEDLEQAFNRAKQIDASVIVEQHIHGYDVRLLVIGGKLIAAARRDPAHVIGDGRHTIAELISKINEDPDRGEGHAKVLTLISIDQETETSLDKYGYDLKTIPQDGELVYVKETANISTGGTATDVTKQVHPLNVSMAERASRIIGLNVMGIDLLCESIEEPVECGRGGIVEVNAAPGFRMHVHPSHGESINVAEPIVDMLFPEGVNHSVPIVAVTGTNGKTTTARLISHILSYAGHVVGLTSTDAVLVDNVPILRGDYSGPGGAEALMKDATVTHAVLEVARGGILRRGLGFKRCDVGVFLNVSSDHLGLGDIDTLEELTRLKSTVTEVVKKDGFAVFNADDEQVCSRAHRTKGSPMYFSLDPMNPILRDNLAKGFCNVILEQGNIMIQRPGGTFSVAHVNEIPMTFHGQATFNIANVLAATAATFALGISEEHIRAGLLSFSPSTGQSPGRMNVIDIGDFKVIIDYGHNTAAVEATGPFIKNLMPGRKIRMSAGVGDRREEDILAYGRSIATYFDYAVVCDSVPRTRALGQTAEILKQGLLDGGFTEDQIEIILDEREATKRALEMARSGDLVLLQVEDINGVTQDVLEFKRLALEKQQERDA